MPGDTIDVWIAVLDVGPTPLAELAAHLSPDERERAARFHFAQHRDRFVAARGILRTLLATRYLGARPEAVRLRYGPTGKPSLAHPDQAGLHFNLAHADDVAAYAFRTGASVGIDLEPLRPLADLDGLAATVLTRREREELARVRGADRTRAFLQVWTRKEAYLKLTGAGLSRAPSTFEVTVAPGDPPIMRSVDGRPPAASVTLIDLVVADGLVAALATRAPVPRIAVMHWHVGQGGRSTGVDAPDVPSAPPGPRVTLPGNSERDS